MQYKQPYKKYACNRLLLPDGQRLNQCVVCVDADGRVVEWYTFSAEEAFVQWIGGYFLLLPQNIIPSIGEIDLNFYIASLDVCHTNVPLYAWHPVDATKLSDACFEVKYWQQLK